MINEKLEIIIQGAKKARDAIGSDAKEAIGNVAVGSAAGSSGSKVDELVEGIKGIVKVVLKDTEGEPEAGTDKKAGGNVVNRTGSSSGNDEAGKLFDDSGNASGIGASAKNAKQAAADASKAVGAVTGADILQAISQGNSGDAAKLGSAKDATIAGAIALRAMAKDGKFPGVSSTASSDKADYILIVKGAAVGAVTKALDTLTIAIRNTIDDELKKVKEAMNINANDTPTTIEAKN